MTFSRNPTPTKDSVSAFRPRPGLSRFAVIRPFTLAGSLLTSAVLFAGVFYPEGATTMHFAFEGSPNGDRPIVRAPAIYYPEDGFGFVDSPGLIGTAKGVAAPKHFRFDVNLPAGIYDVSVTLGGAAEESVTSIKAEGNQAVLPETRVARGQNAVKTFVVTVKRGAAGDKSVAGDGRLTLEFDGTNPSLMKLDIKPSEKPTAAP